MNAADTVYALSAMLECPHAVEKNFESDQKR
jgi:tRNA A37 threonylcarbamoyladenosine synthetase subunit TsaC/SUA5/YrdC